MQTAFSFEVMDARSNDFTAAMPMAAAAQAVYGCWASELNPNGARHV
jgi:hypothetical protein